MVFKPGHSRHVYGARGRTISRLDVFRFGLEFVIVVGCFWVILAPTAASDNVAAFGLLGVVVASIVHNLAKDGTKVP